jgi:hypothetical protein
MRNDQIFVLLLVILLPMSGCFDGTVGDAEGTDDAESGATVINNYYNQTSNQPPVIYVAEFRPVEGNEVPYADYGKVSTYDSNSGEELTRMYHLHWWWWFSVIDVDGNITEVGIDLDLDQVIDHHFTTNDSWSNFSYQVSPGIAASNGSTAAGWWDCHYRFNLMAIDNNGGIGLIPYTMGDGELPHDVRGCQEDYTGAEE